ncbi:MAG: CDP-diacylglycerol--glycerol-3-phosphate 3-phosphatidyltransferase [Erythrobacter sp.]|nr:CDP-diacylglycerol--glycerol-3-phosphate 3-phosphatidyltransferase [Erythrobacter sp.]NCQ63247.1 CDP-diacylglycerol--glycerol-3-phosphate 3-phosphatidyltransferase [Alphaproteobacteria bacterium]
MLTLPNLLTLSRIFAVPLLVLFLWWPDWQLGYAVGLALYAAAAVTDYFDGALARSRGTVSKLGQFLDPIADKIMVAAVILILTAKGGLSGPMLGDLHVIAGLIILMREIIVSGLREFLGGIQVSVPVTRLAKWKTTLQMVALGLLILAGALPEIEAIRVIGLVSLWIAAVLTCITGYGYLRVGLQHMDS